MVEFTDIPPTLFNDSKLTVVREVLPKTHKPVEGQYINQKSEMKFLIVATYSFDRDSMRIYARRWDAGFFKAIKSAGFNIEETYLTDKHRLEKLFALVSIAFIWAYKV